MTKKEEFKFLKLLLRSWKQMDFYADNSSSTKQEFLVWVFQDSRNCNYVIRVTPSSHLQKQLIVPNSITPDIDFSKPRVYQTPSKLI